MQQDFQGVDSEVSRVGTERPCHRAGELVCVKLRQPHVARLQQSGRAGIWQLCAAIWDVRDQLWGGNKFWEPRAADGVCDPRGARKRPHLREKRMGTLWTGAVLHGPTVPAAANPHLPLTLARGVRQVAWERYHSARPQGGWGHPFPNTIRFG